MIDNFLQHHLTCNNLHIGSALRSTRPSKRARLCVSLAEVCARENVRGKTDQGGSWVRHTYRLGGGISTLKVNSICCQHQIKNWTLSAAFGLQRMYAISWQLPLVRVSLFFPSIKTTKLVYSLPPLHSLSPVSPNHCQGAYIA